MSGVEVLGVFRLLEKSEFKGGLFVQDRLKQDLQHSEKRHRRAVFAFSATDWLFFNSFARISFLPTSKCYEHNLIE